MEFLQHLFNEVKQKRLKTAEAVELLRQFHTRGATAAVPPYPLLQRDTSDRNGHRFTSDFDGSEFFLEHHRVRGQRVLPGVAYLDMARAAALRVSGAGQVQLRSVHW